MAAVDALKKAAKDCEETVCASKMDLLARMGGGARRGGAPGAARGKGEQCPLDREQLGRSTWDLLHTMAAYYPERPSADELLAASGFIKGLAALYPCSHCAEDFRESVRRDPPRYVAPDSAAAPAVFFRAACGMRRAAC